MTNLPSQPAADRSKYILLTPNGAKALSVVAIGSLYAWFVLKLFLTTETPVLQLIVGALGLIGVLSSVVMFLCTYSFVANAPDKYLDEREIQDRNAAYMRAYIYAVSMLLVGYIASDVVGKVYSGFEVTPEVLTNYLNLALFTCLIMPATILAWRDRSPVD
ncbi:MAG: hypothetical protein FJY62_05540 [Betaproteobacteria bacterium]|nr:hypothetical protein [Betaproteobacteria bacterium]